MFKGLVITNMHVFFILHMLHLDSLLLFPLNIDGLKLSTCFIWINGHLFPKKSC
jgi:hypothetical protein